MRFGLTLTKNTAYLIKNPCMQKVLSGLDIPDGTIIYGEKKIFFIDARYFFEVKNDIVNAGFTPVLYEGDNSIKNYLKQNKIKTLLIDFDTTTLSDFKTLKNLKVKLKDGSKSLRCSRSIKTDDEIDKIQKACNIIEEAVYYAFSCIKLGVTEKQIKNLLEDKIKALGGDGTSFDTIVAFGKNSAIPHHVSDDTVLQNDTVVLIDAGAKYKGYSSDITRTVFFGRPDKTFIDRYTAVLKANQLAIENAKSGMEYKAIDDIARSYLKENNLDKYFTHSLGHGLGVEIHEYPRLSPKGEGVAQENVVFTIEPGVYFENEYGIRIEDTVVIKEGKIKRLTVTDKTLLTI